jgi:hypothetical protein
MVGRPLGLEAHPRSRGELPMAQGGGGTCRIHSGSPAVRGQGGFNEKHRGVRSDLVAAGASGSLK